MADFLSQFIGKDETPSVEFKHHRGNRKVSDSEGSNGRFGESWLIRNMSDSGIRNFLHHLLPGTNPAIKFKGVHRKGDGSSGLLIFNLREDGVNHPITIPFTATTSAFDLKELIDPDNLEHPIKGEFPSEVSDSSKRVKDSTKKVKDAEGNDNDDFEDEPEREFTDEEIIEWIKDGYDGDSYGLYIEAYQDKGYDDDIWETMDRLDDVIVDQPASWLLDRMFYGDFNPRHAYWRFNGYGNLESFGGSFTSLFDKHIDETVMVEYIRDNMDKYREYIEEYFEDNED